MPRVPSPVVSMVSIAAGVRTRGIDVEVSVANGRVVALVGPNGAGKSSLLQLVSGQLRPSSGTVTLAGEVVSGPGVYVPVHRRRIALLEQRPLLFDHLTVVDNVAFGLRERRAGKRAARARARAELDLVGCGELAANRAWELSGGQAQRVALARALVVDPRMVLLDEPLAALDAGVAPAIRAVLRDRLRGRTALMVTHDVLDVLTLADEVVVLDGGRVVEQGPVSDVLARPRSRFLADLTGVNLLHGVGVAPDVVEVDGLRLTGLPRDGDAFRPGSPYLATVAPSAVAVHLIDPGGSPRNSLPATVAALEPRGAVVRVETHLAGGQRLAADVTAVSAVRLHLAPGTPVRLVVKATQVTLYAR